MERTVYNKSNKGHIKGHYPAFLGDDLGVGSDVDISFPRIEELKELQRSMFWSPREVNLQQDAIDVIEADPVATDLMLKNIMWQQGMDSVASRSIGAMLLPHATNPEVVRMLSEFQVFETYHEESYSFIIRSLWKDNPKEIIQDIYNNEFVHKRIEMITESFDAVFNMHHSDNVELKKRNIAKALAVLMFAENVCFMNSFTVTFQITEATGRYSGVSETVSKIAQDEQIHGIMSYEMMEATKVDGWGYVYESIKEDLQRTYDTILEGELAWVDYLFSEGRELGVIGLTKESLKDQVKYFAWYTYQMAGLTPPFERVADMPIKSYDKYVDRSVIQSANQEIQSVNYLAMTVDNNITPENDFSFEGNLVF